MGKKVILNYFKDINKGNKGRASNKPLLLLYALGKISEGVTDFSFKDCEKEYGSLLKAYGHNSDTKTHYAFYRLKNDSNGKLWDLKGSNKKFIENTSGDVSKKMLLSNNIRAGFKKEIIDFIFNDKKIINEIAELILLSHFPESYYINLIEDIGLDFSIRIKRNNKFRKNILDAYGYQCAICKQSIRIGSNLINLEAAHIKWKCRNGVDEVNNGLALCSTHHILFDRGAFTITPDFRVMFSESLNSQGSKEMIDEFHGHVIQLPVNKFKYPYKQFLEWHDKEVFHGNPLPLN